MKSKTIDYSALVTDTMQSGDPCFPLVAKVTEKDWSDQSWISPIAAILMVQSGEDFAGSSRPCIYVCEYRGSYTLYEGIFNIPSDCEMVRCREQFPELSPFLQRICELQKNKAIEGLSEYGAEYVLRLLVEGTPKFNRHRLRKNSPPKYDCPASRMLASLDVSREISLEPIKKAGRFFQEMGLLADWPASNAKKSRAIANSIRSLMMSR